MYVCMSLGSYSFTTIGYPWDVLVDQTTTNFCLKKWLFLTDYPQMLEKVVLYGKLKLSVSICL